MKRKVVALLTAIAVVYGALAFPMNFQKIGNTSVAAAVTDTVPEGYTPIYTIDDLYGIRNDLSGKYILMNDIDLSETAPGGDWDSGNGWKPIGGAGEEAFSGVFDGNGYAIKNMHIYGEWDANKKNIGLFSNVSGKIYRLALVDCDIDVTLSDINTIFIGSIVGTRIFGYMDECYTSGNIKVANESNVNYMNSVYIGGVFGTDYNSRNSGENLYNTCMISVTCSEYDQEYYIGGITGDATFIRNCYNAGKITLDFSDGIDNSNAKYRVGNLTGNSSRDGIQSGFYLKTLSEFTASSNNTDEKYTNVVGLTPGQMKSQAAYTDFDFDTVWTIDPTSDYPYPTLRNVPYVPSVEEPTTETTTEPTTEPTTSPSSAPLKGDINEDGVVNASDAALILIYAAKIGAGEQVSIDDLY